MSRYAINNACHLARRSSAEDANMFGLRGMGNMEPIHVKWEDVFPVEGELLRARGGVAEQLCLLWDHGDMVEVGILESKGEEPMELVGAVGDQRNIISLANTSNVCWPQLYSKAGPMGQSELSIICEFVEPVAKDSTLLDPQKVRNRTHKTFFPFNKSFLIFEPVIKKHKTLA